MKTEQFKKDVENLLKDYIEVKKNAINLGYEDKVFNFKDYIDYYIKLNQKNN